MVLGELFFLGLFLLCCPQKEEEQTSSVFMSDHLKANRCVLREAESGRVLAEQQLLRNARFTFQFTVALPRSPHACLPGRLIGDMVLPDKSSCSKKTHPAIIFSNSIPSDDPYGG